MELTDSIRPIPEELKWQLSRLDGKRRFAFSIAPLPEGVAWNAVNLNEWPTEFLQCAGNADRMTIEIRWIADGRPVLSVVGRGLGATETSELNQKVAWDEFETLVREDELFSWETAAAIFEHYYRTGSIPETLSLRDLDFTT
jgi:hypothetical protein